MIPTSLNRRTFIKQSSAAALSFAFLPNLISRPAPSDKLRIAHIGLGGMGTQHLKWFAALPEVDIVGLCDVDETHLGKAKKVLTDLHPDTKVETFNDFRRILERKDIDAITCATPDHWHAQVAILAFQAGKDVYGEKPLSFSVKEGQKMLKALKRHDRVFQLGTQIHAGDNYHRVVEIIKAGTIGKVHTVRLWKTGPPPTLPPPQYQTPPSSLNWDYWLGPAPYAKYSPERCHFTYRYFMDYSGGVFQDFWCHIADIVWWAIEPKNLSSVSARGPVSDTGGDTPKSIEVDYQFEGLKLFWTSTPPNVAGAADKHIGAYFEGDKGTLLCDYSTRQITINGQIEETPPSFQTLDTPRIPKILTDIEGLPLSIPRSPGHQQNFVNAVKTRTQPESNLEYARLMTMPMHLGLISWRLGRPLNWNPKKEKFINDHDANALLNRKYRKGWDWI